MSTGRLLALGDGIFAIAMTLLVFEVKVPEHAAGGAELQARLLELWPRFASCGLGFLTLGYAWIGHHNQYVAIRRTDRLFLWINIAFFAAIALVPFSCGLLGEYPFERTAVIFYALNLFTAGVLLWAHWAYATSGRRLVDPELDAAFIQRTARRVMTAPLAYLMVIALSFLSVTASLIVSLAIPLYFMIPGRVDRHWKGP
jgi:uncharacterized membrane protein